MRADEPESRRCYDDDQEMVGNQVTISFDVEDPGSECDVNFSACMWETKMMLKFS